MPGNRVWQVIDQQARSDVKRCPGEHAAEGADLDIRVTDAQPRRGRLGIPTVVGTVRDKHPRLLAGERDIHGVEVLAQHVVHAEAHVFDPPAREHNDIGRGVRGDQPRDVAERLERPGEPHEHDTSIAHQLRIERERGDGCFEPGRPRVGSQRALAAEGVLMNADDTIAGIARAREGQGAERVADDGDLAPRNALSRLR